MKKLLAAVLAAAMMLSLAACGGTGDAAEPTAAPEATAEPEAAPEPTDAPAGDQTGEVYVAEEPLHVAGMRGPTTIGLANLVEASEAGADVGSLNFDEVYPDATEIVQLLIKEELDAAAVPANVAANLYQKTGGGVQVACVNTLGVLYVLEKGETVQSVADLAGKTILCPGKGSTPEYVLRYVLAQNGLDPDSDVIIEFKNEALEVLNAFVAEEDPNVVALLPQPNATTALSAAEGSREALDMTAEWDKVADSKLVTGVLVVRKDAVEADPARFDQFMKDYQDSVDYANSEIETTAALCEKFGIVPQADLAEKALPKCNIVFETGEEMKADLSGYLQVLFDADPESVGGALPGDDFYYGV